MQKSHFWNKCYLHWPKVILFLGLFLIASSGFSQGYKEVFNPNYDNKKFSYGFLIGLHKTGYKLKYSDKFVTNDLDTLHSIQPVQSPGFSLGFLVNYRLGEFFDLRITPKVAFYEYKIEYYYTSGLHVDQLKEATVVEFPIVFKYKSDRRGNSRMYVLAGLKPGFEASGKNDIASSRETLNINRLNFSADFGLGFDLYFPLFKFSPELRFSKGLANMLSTDPSIYNEGLARLNTNTIHLYLLFQ